jgi:hypothetical protein
MNRHINFPVRITHNHLPLCHKHREILADKLAAFGFIVRVDRFGTGNAEHSGVLAGCGVSSITVNGYLPRCTIDLLDVWNNLPDGAVSVDGEAHPFPFSINR